jgi:hypothetical protein
MSEEANKTEPAANPAEWFRACRRDIPEWMGGCHIDRIERIVVGLELGIGSFRERESAACAFRTNDRGFADGHDHGGRIDWSRIRRPFL